MVQEETLWCLWKHFKSFLEQSIEELFCTAV